VLRRTFSRLGGVEVDTQGDAFFYAFPDAPGALAAAREGQEALEAGPIRVRMGLHTGMPHIGTEGYIGEDVHLGACIAASAHGGQVVCSKQTQELASNSLLQGTVFLDLGEHRLKDIEEAVWIYQLGHQRFPPLKTISNTNLPRPASSFVGREREVEEVLSLLREDARLVTLSGSGGSGKTRLAIEAASELVPDFKAGVFWVGLAALRDPDLVTETIAQALGAKDGLAEYIRERELLLLLDNVEQVIDCAPELASLVEACPNLHLLVTSRELLRVRGEVEYAVPPLAEPEAVELFCQRSRLESDKTIVELCRRLDNLPLAVELAAARTKVLTPSQILERLSQRLDLLKGGRDAEARQQTLGATIAWSYDLLSVEEQRLFARLSVFAGGCTLEAAEEVTEADLDTLQSLVEKSLLRLTNGRFWMLETIREYAADRLEEAGDTESLHRSLALYLFEMAKGLPAAAGEEAGQAEAHDRFQVEYRNLRTVVEWALEREDRDLVLHLTASLSEFLSARGHAAEANGWLVCVLPDDAESWTSVDSQSLYAVSKIAQHSGHLDRAKVLKLQLVERDRADHTRADEALVAVLSDLSDIARAEGNVIQARAYAEEAVALSERAGFRTRAVSSLATVALEEGNLDEAEQLLDEAARGWKGRHEWNYGVSLAKLGDVALRKGQADTAANRFRAALRCTVELGDAGGIADCLDDLGAVAAFEGRLERAAKLAGAADAARADWWSSGFAPGRQHEELPPEAIAEGAAMGLEEAIEYALSDLD
jgi:predicted ATPase